MCGAFRARAVRPRLVLLAAVLVLTGACQRAPEAGRVVFVGIDGASWKILGPMIEAGELPAFRRLATEGAHCPSLETIAPVLSPRLWTTIATGRSAKDHGVVDFTETLPNGERIPVSGSARKVKALWEVATEHDRSVGTIGWWASWPAETVDGYVVSDHANPVYSDFLAEDGRYLTADRAALRALERDVFPLDLAPLLERHAIDKASFPWDELHRRSGLSGAQMERLREAPWNERSVYSLFKTFYAADRIFLTLALDLMKNRPTALQMLYLRGPDPLQHYGWNLVEPERFARAPENLERDRGLVEGVYRYLDSYLEELLQALPANAWLIVASDHGAEPSPEAGDADSDARPGEHTATAKGVLFVYGPGVKPGHRISRATLYDLMPTAAWLLDLPLSEELEGAPLREAFAPRFDASKPVTRVASYGGREARDAVASKADEAMLESLKTLGYLQ